MISISLPPLLDSLRAQGVPDLVPGSVLRARVVSSQGGQSILQWPQGRLTLPVSLPVGATVQLKLHNERLEVTVLQQAADSQPQGTPAAPVTALARLLVAAGIPADGGFLRDLQKLLGNDTSADLRALTLVLARQLPFSPSILASLSRLVQTRLSAGEPLAALLASLNSGATAPVSPALLAALREALTRQLTQWNDIGLGDARALAGILRRETAGLEGLLADLLTGNGSLEDIAGGLKPLLLALRREWSTGNEPALALVERALDALDQQRLINQPDAAGQQRWYIQLPLPDAQPPRTAELLIRRDDSRAAPSSQGKAYTLVFVAHLSRLGGVRVQAFWQPSRLEALIHCDTASGAHTLRAALPDLETRLRAAGCEHIRCAVQHVATVAPLRLEDLLPELRLVEPRGGLDVRA